jgi:hypothetical protein
MNALQSWICFVNGFAVVCAYCVRRELIGEKGRSDDRQCRVLVARRLDASAQHAPTFYFVLNL